MFSEYQKNVIYTYKKLLNSGRLAPNLVHLTPAKVKEECLLVYKERPHVQDDRTLRNFFGSKGNHPDYRLAMERTNPDKFKSLIRYLKNETRQTDSKNIELLAWLLGYEPRPYELNYGRQVQVEQIDTTLTSETTERKQTKYMDSSDSTQAKRHPKTRKAIRLNWILGVLLLGAVCVYFVQSQKPSCMYWNGSQFEVIDCQSQIPGKRIWSLDKNQLENFKRITRIDTLSYKDIGSVWYTKITADSIEYFTDGGTHPTHQKHLKPITKYMIDKYISP